MRPNSSLPRARCICTALDTLLFLPIVPVGVEGSNKRFQLLVEPPFHHTQLRNAPFRRESIRWNIIRCGDCPDSSAFLAWGIPHGIDQERQDDLIAPEIPAGLELPVFVGPP